MSRLFVDTESVRALAARLENLRSQLNGVADLGASYSSLGPWNVSNSVARFCQAWKVGLDEVDEHIMDVSSRVAHAADKYEATEAHAAGSMQSEGL